MLPYQGLTEKYLAMISRFSNQSFGDFESRAFGIFWSFFEKLRTTVKEDDATVSDDVLTFHILHFTYSFFGSIPDVVAIGRIARLQYLSFFDDALAIQILASSNILSLYFPFDIKGICDIPFVYLFPHVSVRYTSKIYTNHLVGLKRWRATSPALQRLTDTDLFCIHVYDAYIYIYTYNNYIYV